MRQQQVEGILQTAAGISLVYQSHVLLWHSADEKFLPQEFNDYEESWRQHDELFGRLACWILFSSGIEMVAKGTILLSGIEIRRKTGQRVVPMLGYGELSEFNRLSGKLFGDGDAQTFGTLGSLLARRNGNDSILDQLFSRTSAASHERDIVYGCLESLRGSIRNRDVHAYVPNVRDADFSRTNHLYCEALNLLLCWSKEFRTSDEKFLDAAQALIRDS